MPAFINTPEKERLWEEAKQAAAEAGLSEEKDGKRYWRYVTAVFKRMGGLKKGLLVRLRKAGDHWREQARDRYGKWTRENGSIAPWESLLIPDPTPEKCQKVFDALYRQEPFHALNPLTKSQDLLVRFGERAWHHVCYVPSDETAYHAARGEEERERLRDQFVAERAARIAWIGRTLLDPDEIRLTKYRGQWAWGVLRRMPEGQPYAVFLRSVGKGGAEFSSAYPLTGRDLREFRSGKPLYKRVERPEEMAKSLCRSLSDGLPAATNTGATRGRPALWHREMHLTVASSGLPRTRRATRQPSLGFQDGAACRPQAGIARGAANLGPSLYGGGIVAASWGEVKGHGHRLFARFTKSVSGLGVCGARPIYCLLRKRVPAPDERWITVHPHGEDQPGVPVLIKLHPDGSAHVVAGAGGKLNYMRLTRLKSPQQLEVEARERRAQAAERRKVEPEELRAQREEVAKEIKAAEIKAQAEFLSKVSEAQGWGDWRLPEELKKQMTEKQADRLERARLRSVMSQAQHLVENIRDKVIEEHDAEVARNLGETSLPELDTVAEKNRDGLGYVAAVERMAREEGLLKPQETLLSEQLRDRAFRAAEDNGYIESADRAEAAVQLLQSGAEKAREQDRPFKEQGIHRVEVETELKDPTAAKDILLAYRDYQEVQRRLDRERLRLSGTDPELIEQIGTGVTMIADRGGAPKDVQALEEQLEADLQQAALRKSSEKLLSEIETAQERGVPNVAIQVSTGRYTALNEVSETVLHAPSVVDRLTADLLGTDAAATLMAHVLRRDLSPQQLELAREALGHHHVETQRQIAEKAIVKARDLIKAADAAVEGIDFSDATADDLLLAQQANQERKRKLRDASATLGEALGRLEAVGTLNFALMGGEPAELRCALGQVSSRRALQIRAALGLEKGEAQVVSDGPNKFLVVKKEAWDKLARPVDKEAAKLYQDALAIKRGEQDEEGWLPKGFRDPKSLPDFPEAEEAFAFARPLKLTATMSPDEVKAETFDFLDRALADNPYNPRAVRHEATCAEFVNAYVPKKVQEAYAKAIAEYFPEKDLDEAGVQKMYKERVEQARQKMIAAGEAPATAEALDTQALELGETTYDAIHEALAKVPEAAVVFRPVKTPEDRRAVMAAIQDYFWRRLTTEKREEVAAARVKAREAQKKAEATAGVQFDMFGNAIEVPAAAEATSRQEAKVEPSAWERYVDSFGSGVRATERAYEAIQDHMRGEFLDEFGKQYARRYGVQLKTGTKRVPHWDRFVIGTASKDVREALLQEEASQRASAQARVATRVRGKFSTGERRELAEKILQRSREAHQLGFFSEGQYRPISDRTTIGETAEAQLAKIVPEIARNFKPGQKVDLPPAMSMDGRFVTQQRAIKMVETSGRVGAHLGVGSGKTAIGLGAFTDLHKKGKAHRAIYAVPSVVAGQFGSEALRFLEPRSPDGKKGYRWQVASGLPQEERLRAYRDPNLHMVFVTHQALRDDIVHEVAREMFRGDQEKAAHWMRTAPEEQRRIGVQLCLRKAGWNFDFSMIDEGHDLLNRKGKPNSLLANALDDFTAAHPWHISATGTPVKNDISEAFDILRKLRPDKYPKSAWPEFQRRYGLNTRATREALQREMAPYVYAERVDPGAKAIVQEHVVDLTPQQRAGYREVWDAYRQARRAPAGSDEQVAAIRKLSGERFANVTPEEARETARQLSSAKGMLRDMALQRLTHAEPAVAPGANGKLQQVVAMARSYRNKDADGGVLPGVIFAHNLESVRQIREALSKEGFRVGSLTGQNTTTEKEMARLRFNPTGSYDDLSPAEKAKAQRDAARYDILVCSDAAAVGANLQRGGWLVHYDQPDTAKTHEQRTGRIHRIGQGRPAVFVHELVANTPLDQKRRQRVLDKHELAETFQEPTELLDDTGLAKRLREERVARLKQGLRAIRRGTGGAVLEEREAAAT